MIWLATSNYQTISYVSMVRFDTCKSHTLEDSMTHVLCDSRAV